MKAIGHLLADDDGILVPFKRSPNQGGHFEPRFIVMHYTAGRSAESAAAWLCNPKAKASAHFVIGRDGHIIQLVPLNCRAWHAGKSDWNELSGLNEFSYGIELDNPGWLVRKGGRWTSLALGTQYDDADVIEAPHKNGGAVRGWLAYPEAQILAAYGVCEALVDHAPLVDVIGHDDIAPSRKLDPGPAFPMDSFRSWLFGREGK